MMLHERIILYIVVIAVACMLYNGGYWVKYQPREGIECTVFHGDYGYAMDCYKVELEQIKQE